MREKYDHLTCYFIQNDVKKLINLDEYDYLRRNEASKLGKIIE